MHIYSIEDYLAKANRAASDDDAVAFALASRFVIENCIELILIFRNKYWLPIHHMSRLIKSVDLKFYTLLVSFNTEKSFQKSQISLSKLAKYTVQIAGGPLPQTWSVKR